MSETRELSEEEPNFQDCIAVDTEPDVDAPSADSSDGLVSADCMSREDTILLDTTAETTKSDTSETENDSGVVMAGCMGREDTILLDTTAETETTKLDTSETANDSGVVFAGCMSREDTILLDATAETTKSDTSETANDSGMVLAGCLTREESALQDTIALDTTAETTKSDTSRTADDSGVAVAGCMSKEESAIQDAIVLDTTPDPESGTSKTSNKSGVAVAGCMSKEESAIQDAIVLDTTPDPESGTSKTSNKSEMVLAGCVTREESALQDTITLDTTAETIKSDTSRTADDSGVAVAGCMSREETVIQDAIVLDTTSDPKSGTTKTSNDNDYIMPEMISLDVTGDEQTRQRALYDIVPRYDTGPAGVLSDIEYSMITGKKVNDARPKKTCFNCLGDHNLNDCQEPLNQRTIQQNRSKYRNTKGSSMRYHEDSDNKFGQFQPGRISDNLRHALGLRQYQLPLYIYRMRVLGYPPGWLKDAEVRQADLKLYDGKGRSVLHPDEEEGETDTTLIRYKPEKLVSFPGFNDYIPRGMRDEWRELNFIPMQENHSRYEFLRFMNQNRAGTYKKKKLDSKELSRTSFDDIPTSMEVDESDFNRSAEIEFRPPLPQEPPPRPSLPPLPTTALSDAEDGEISEDSQASIGDLEEKRREILRELEESTSQTSITGNINSNPPPDNENSENSKSSISFASDHSESENSLMNSDEPEVKKLKKHHRSHSKGFKLGATIPESCTPFEKLPPAVSWTVDVTDHINFENLPDALGTWSKMKGLMKHVKRTIDFLHQDD